MVAKWFESTIRTGPMSTAIFKRRANLIPCVALASDLVNLKCAIQTGAGPDRRGRRASGPKNVFVFWRWWKRRWWRRWIDPRRSVRERRHLCRAFDAIGPDVGSRAI